jgi:3-phosphoshikimate 1-carboxyvinyltransferase
MISLRAEKNEISGKIRLPASKSIYNRILILNALYKLDLNVKNPSITGDGILMEQLLKSNDLTIDCGNAGTVYRFLLSYFTALGVPKILTGESRMLQPPVFDLVAALKNIGAKIEFLEKEGYPPVKIIPQNLKPQNIQIDGSLSSQFISSLIMIGPYLGDNFTIQITGKPASRPYISMTVKLMQDLGFEIHFKNNEVNISPVKTVAKSKDFEVEADYSPLIFWYQWLAYSKTGELLLEGMNNYSIQGDANLINWAGMLGIQCGFNSEGLLLKKSEIPVLFHTEWNLADVPDLAPGIIVLLAGLKKTATFYGLESLKIKESDRTLALQTELEKCKVKFYQEKDAWYLDASAFSLTEGTIFESYNDHRIAMALAPLCTFAPIKIQSPEAIQKSYPEYWNQLKALGVSVN